MWRVVCSPRAFATLLHTKDVYGTRHHGNLENYPLCVRLKKSNNEGREQVGALWVEKGAGPGRMEGKLQGSESRAGTAVCVSTMPLRASC